MEDQNAQESSKEQQKPGVHISIGGGVGPGSAIGSKNSVDAEYIVSGNLTIGAAVENTTHDDFVHLLQQIQDQISQLQNQFQPDDATDAKDALTKATQISKRDDPPVDRLKQNLEIVHTIVENTAKTSAAVAPLVLLVQKAISMFPHLFGS